MINKPRIGIFNMGCCIFNHESNVTKAGGIPVLIHTDANPETIPDIISDIDGLIIPGGADVIPENYGEKIKPEKGVYCYPEKAEAFQIAAIRLALGIGMPILGVCRGEQLLNVVAGGTLWQDYSSDLHISRHRGIHEINIAENSRLAEIFNGAKTTIVNSLHHQAVKAMAPGFIASAFAPDGIIEGIQNSANKTQFGVQFHPEVTGYNPLFYQFFNTIVQDAAAFHSKKEMQEGIA